MTSPFDGLQVPRELVCEFFAVFSRFEYTLKESGFVKDGNERATPDWEKYARSVAAHISTGSNAGLEQAIRYLIDDPPQVQMLQDGAAVWRPTPL